MDKDEIIAQAAREGLVEKVVLAVTHRRTLTYDLQDLVQIVYVALLQKDGEVIRGLHETQCLRHYIARVVIRQLFSDRSRYRREVLRFGENVRPLEDAMDVPDE